MSLEKCADALRDYARKHQEGGSWSCCVMGFEPDNEAVMVILDFYKIPPEWFGGAEPEAAAEDAAHPTALASEMTAPAGGTIDLMSLL